MKMIDHNHFICHLILGTFTEYPQFIHKMLRISWLVLYYFQMFLLFYTSFLSVCIHFCFHSVDIQFTAIQISFSDKT